MAVAAALVAATLAACSSSSAKSEAGTGALIRLRSTSATFIPTTPDGNTGILSLPDPIATFNHNPSAGSATSVPAQAAVLSLGDQPNVQAVLRRPGAPATQDAYGVTLSNISYSTPDGFSANATVRPPPDAKLLAGDRQGLDKGPIPNDLGHVELHAADTNVQSSSSNKPVPPKSGADNYQLFLKVFGTFPVNTEFKFTPKYFHCAKDNALTPENKGGFQKAGTDEIGYPLAEVDAQGACFWEASTVQYEISIQPPGVNDLDKLYVYIHADQYAPYSFSTACVTIAQPKRPRCRSTGVFQGNVVEFRIDPAA